MHMAYDSHQRALLPRVNNSRCIKDCGLMLLTGQRLDFRLRSVESMGADTYPNCGHRLQVAVQSDSSNMSSNFSIPKTLVATVGLGWREKSRLGWARCR